MENNLPEIDILGILKVLPHRYPFILVDRILAMTPGESIVGLKNVTINEPYFQGHFPSRPIVPGVLIVEGMAQTAGVLAYHSDTSVAGKLVYLAGVDKVRFRRKIEPGDQIIFYLQVVNKKSKMWKFSAEAKVDGKLAAQAELLATFA